MIAVKCNQYQNKIKLFKFQCECVQVYFKISIIYISKSSLFLITGPGIKPFLLITYMSFRHNLHFRMLASI